MRFAARRLVLVVLLAAGCATPSGSPAPSGAGPAAGTTAGAAEIPAVALCDTGVRTLASIDFDAFHGPGSVAPVFGALPIEPAPPDVPAATAAFLGRWEGYGLAPPIRRDWKYVLAVTSVTAVDGRAYLWASTNLQFPALVEEIRFRVAGSGDDTRIQWEQDLDHAYSVVSLTHAAHTDALEAVGTGSGGVGVDDVLLRRDSATMTVARDYAATLAARGIAWHDHEDPALLEAGAGELVFLPDGYEADPGRRWPLLLFLHGSGDRGDDGLVLAQNSPFRFITGGGRLDAVIVAPLLRRDQPAFPDAYLSGVLDDALARYRIDPGRVAMTGLSMGGEAAYRLARTRPDDVAALAVLCGFETDGLPAAAAWGYPPIEAPWSALAGMPVLVIHGEDDQNVPIAAAQAAVEAMRAAGVEVRFEALPHRDHDVWTDTYDDPAFYAWLLDAMP
jgi:predicted esterase